MKTAYNSVETTLKLRGAGDEIGIVPRTLTKKAIRAYFKVTKERYGRIITDKILVQMKITPAEHRKIREYNVHQTAVIVKALDLTREELIDLGRLM